MSELTTQLPDVDRWRSDRTEPVSFDVHTRWLYSPRQERDLDGRPWWPFSRSGVVVRSDVPTRSVHLDDVRGHLNRAIELFGDDADLTVTVTRREVTL